MLGLFTKRAQREPPPLRGGEIAPAENAVSEDRAPASLALARELLHTVEQFVISTPDLDTARFLQRLRGTAAGLTTRADAPSVALYRLWVRKALGAFARLQRRYVAEREDEMWRLLDLYSSATQVGRTRTTELLSSLRTSHERIREIAALPDIRAARQQLEEEVTGIQRLVDQKAREDRERADALGRQVARLEAALAAVRGQANYDVLTKVFHRGSLQDRLAEMLASGKRCSVALLDVDNFKTINDSLGHLVGDRMLALIGEQLIKVARTTDVPARFGGDEFCFVAAGFSTEQLAQRLAGATARRHVRLELEERFVSVLLSVSVGIAGSAPGDTVDSLLDRADQALLAAKEGGKGGIRIAPPRVD